MAPELKEALMRQAAILGPGRERCSRPSDEENAWGWARCAAMIRRRDASGLARTLEELGFTPKAPQGGDGAGLLWLAASGPGAIGFMELARAIVKEPDTPGWELDLGQKLRLGMAPNARSALEESRESQAREPAKSGKGPVMAALAADAPEALAQLLCEPGWMEALLAMEPAPFEGEWAPTASERLDQIKESGAALEASLIGAALGAQAGGCLALLMEMPEFCHNAARDRLLSVRLSRNPKWRKSQHAFPEAGHGEGSALFGGAKATCPSFFEMLLCVEDHAGERRMEAAIDRLIEKADPAAARPQIGSGMLWPHMLLARSPLWSKEGQALLMKRLSRLSERGFEMAWGDLAGAAQKEAPGLAEWARLQEAAAPAARRAGPKAL